METLSTFKELGIAGIAIVSLATIAYQLLKQLGEARNDYKNYVSENNHTTTELVREATAAIVEVKNTIETHNEIQRTFLNQMKK